MNIVTDIEAWQVIRNNLGNKTIGFVPTMGNLHEGHLQLCQRAKRENEVAIISIFINPTQFNEQQDFATYPRTIEQDAKLLSDHQIDYLFAPEVNQMYPDQYEIQVTETMISRELEGAHRPGHFNGMLTVVLKLLNLIKATRAYFGEKDYQQWLLVKKMVTALFISTDIIACETVRASDQLAFSSRNQRLNPTQRETAAYFPKILKQTETIEKIIATLQSHGFKVDYIAEKWGRRLGAVWLDDVRLIDNISTTPQLTD